MTALTEPQHPPGQGKRCKYKVPPELVSHVQFCCFTLYNMTFRKENAPSLLFSFLFADSLFQVFLSNLVLIPRKVKQNVDKYTLRNA